MGVDLTIACVMDPQCTGAVITRAVGRQLRFYCAIAFVSSLVAFLVFRTRDGMTHLFSVNDALDVAKAVLLSEFFTCLALFSLTRLDGIPRSTPLIHALLLTAGLLSARAFVRMAHSDRDLAPTVNSSRRCSTSF